MRIHSLIYSYKDLMKSRDENSLNYNYKDLLKSRDGTQRDTITDCDSEGCVECTLRILLTVGIRVLYLLSIELSLAGDSTSIIFVATKVCLPRQNLCRDKYFS